METQKPDAQAERETAQSDKQGGESQKGPAAPPPVTEPPHSEAKGRDAEEGKDETDREQDEAIDKLAENTELIAQQTKWERMQGIWVRNQFWASLGLGLLTLIVLAYQTYTLSRQLESMESSSKDTQEMIRAMQKQADAAATQANTSQSIAKQNEELVRHAGEQADALKASLEETRKAANAATAQAAASQTQANASVAQAGIAKQALGAAQSSASAAERNAQIALVGMQPKLQGLLNVVTFEPGKQIKVEVFIENKGGTSALNMITQMGIVRFDPTLFRGRWNREQTTPASVVNVGPMSQSRLVLTTKTEVIPEEFELIKSGQRQLRVWAWGHYDTEFGKRGETFAFCFAYMPAAEGFAACSNEQYEETKPK